MIVTEGNFNQDLVDRAITIAAQHDWPTTADSLAGALSSWKEQGRPYRRQPYVALDEMLAQVMPGPSEPSLLFPKGAETPEDHPELRRERRDRLVAMLRYAAHRERVEADALGIMLPGTEARHRARDRRAMNKGTLSREEFLLRWPDEAARLQQHEQENDVVTRYLLGAIDRDEFERLAPGQVGFRQVKLDKIDREIAKLQSKIDKLQTEREGVENYGFLDRHRAEFPHHIQPGGA